MSKKSAIFHKQKGQTRFFSLGETTSLAEGKLWIQTSETPLKIDFVISCPSGGVGKYDKQKEICEEQLHKNVLI